MRADPHELLHAALGDRYGLEDQLGRGGMGAVYLAYDRKHDRRVAIKTVHPDRYDPATLKRFEREIRITAHLQHAHILPLLDSGTAGGELLYYITPYVEGESLSSRLAREGALSIAEAVRVAVQIAEALDHAHRHGFIHRDIKPGNILLAEGQALLADFGIARGTQGIDQTALTVEGAVVGTLTYMSPEQLLGEPDIDGRTDLYSLGCVLYEMVAGRPPFVGDARTVRWKHLVEDPPRLHEFRLGVSRRLEKVVRRAMAKRPGERFASAAELAAALARCAPQREPRPVLSRGVIVAAVMLLFLLLIFECWPGGPP